MNKLMTAAIALLPLVAFAGDSHDGDTVIGAGASSCGTYISLYEDHQKETLAVITSWQQGYLSGWNDDLITRKLKPLPWVDVQSIQAFTVKYCRDNPLDMVHAATVHLAGELQGRR